MGNASLHKHSYQIVKSLGQTNWLFIAQKGLNYKLDFWVISSQKSYLTKHFLFCFEDWLCKKVWQMACPSNWSKKYCLPPRRLITLPFFETFQGSLRKYPASLMLHCLNNTSTRPVSRQQQDRFRNIFQKFFLMISMCVVYKAVCFFLPFLPFFLPFLDCLFEYAVQKSVAHFLGGGGV